MDVVSPKPGKYVVAVSGGVDSVALLDILSPHPELDLIIAHFDHGIREDSAEDRKLVQKMALANRLPFVFEEAGLGYGASEAEAREARYTFLRQVLKDNGADAIITAHHQDDVLETAIINMLRGTGRRGLTSLGSKGDLVRPLLNVTKEDLINYAQARGLKWHEDSTNSDEKYLRNYVRRQLLTKFNENDRSKLVKIINNLQSTNRELDTLLVNQLQSQSVNEAIDRAWFIKLKHNEAKEVMAAWLRLHGINNYDAGTLERLVIAAKTATHGKVFPVIKNWQMRVNRKDLALEGLER